MNHGRAGYFWDMTGKPHVVEATQNAAENLSDQVASALEELKPKLRGWLHAITAPLTLAAGIVLIVLSPTAATRVGSVIFTLTAGLLFTVSAIYHRGNWSPRTWSILQRFDHANIFLLIAGSYTPFALLMLEGSARTTLLAIAWGGALAGVALRLLWQGAPRLFYTPIYIALGWAAVFYIDDFLASGSTAVFVLIAAGGLLYTAGGVVYGLQKPDPWPSWFGFHEVFHTFTILAFITHYVGVSLATYSLR
jgi:hemolysin III